LQEKSAGDVIFIKGGGANELNELTFSKCLRASVGLKYGRYLDFIINFKIINCFRKSETIKVCIYEY